MGAKIRSTRTELEEMVSGDAAWWPGFLAVVSEKGYKAFPEVSGENVWSWGAFRQWVRTDEGREGEYQVALRDYAEKMVLETVGIADGFSDKDGVEDAKLRVDVRLKVAGKVDVGRWGPSMKHTVERVGDLGERLRRARGREIDVTPGVVGVTEAAEVAALGIEVEVAEDEL